MIKKWIRLSFVYLFIVSILGIFLRMLFFAPIEGVNFKYFLHAHSHVAFLGWIFNALFAALLFAYIPEKARSYRIMFWLLQLAVVGMLCTFPYQGYAAASITFTSLHVFLSWWFAIKFYRDSRRFGQERYKFSLKFIQWSLFFMVFSAIGPFGLGAIMAKGLSGTPLANLAIYFYLHFQYDGWFSFAVFGLFIWVLENQGIPFPKKFAKIFLVYMAVACIPTYALSTLWTKPAAWVYVVAFIAAFLQLIGSAYFFVFFRKISTTLKEQLNSKTINLFLFALMAFYLKIVLQFLSAFPAIAEMAYKVRNFTIGFLHIVFIGFISTFIIGWFGHLKLINLSNRLAYRGMLIFLIGFVISELILFLQPLLLMDGISIPYYFQLLFGISLLMPLGIGLLYFNSGVSENT